MKNYRHILLFLVISIVVFCIILFPREIAFLKTISVLARYNTTRVIPISAILLLAALSLKNESVSIMCTSIIVFALYALALNGLWAGAYTENNVIAGLIPRSDALSFYAGSVSLKESGYLVSYAKRRPLFGGFLATILWLTGGNFQITLAVIAYLLALASFLSILEIRKMSNPPATVVYFLVVFLFIRRQIGITMSETMGVLLGISAFTIFVKFINEERFDQKVRRLFFFLATALFSLSQASRPGAIATLPLLVLLSGWLFRGDKKFSLKSALITIAVILTIIILNSTLYTLITLPGGTQTSNIGYGMYGLIAGGKGWEQIFTDHPIVNQLPAGEIEREVMRIIWEELTTHPENFFKGMAVQFRILFTFQPTNGVYSFTWSKNEIFSYGIVSILYIFCISGIVAAILQRKTILAIMMLTFTLGFFASLPVAPAYQQQYMRYYAASVPFLGFLPAYGLQFLINLLPEKIKKLSFLQEPKNEVILPTASSVFAIIFILFLFAGPLLTQAFSRSELLATGNCETGKDEVFMQYYPGSSIHIFRNDPSIKTWVPNITQLDYKGSIHNICCGPQITYFENIPAPNIMYPGLNLLTGERIYMIADPSMIPDEYGLVHICGHIEDVYKERAERGFLYPDSIELVK